MHDIKFDPKKLAKLNNPERLQLQVPEVMWKAVGLQNPSVVVDIGAGTGFFAKEFCRLAPQAVVYACDLSEVMLQWMTQNLTEVAQGKIKPLLCQEVSLPLPDAQADLAVMMNLHHELHQVQASLKEALRILKPGGKLLISDWKAIPTPMGPPLEIRKNAETILADLEMAGFVQNQSFDLLPQHSLLVGLKP